MNSAPPNPSLPDPEARLTALLLGELPPEAAATLYAEVAAQPEFARLLARLARTLPLVREAVREPAATLAGGTTATSPPRLSPERRDALLARFKTLTPVAFELERPAPRRQTNWLAVAALVTVLLALGATLVLPSLAKAKAKGRNVAAVNERQVRELERLQETAAPADGNAPTDLFLRGSEPAQPIVAGAEFRRGRVAPTPLEDREKAVPLTDAKSELVATASETPGRAVRNIRSPAAEPKLMMRYGLRAKDAETPPAAGRADRNQAVSREQEAVATPSEGRRGESAATTTAGASPLTQWMAQFTNQVAPTATPETLHAYFAQSPAGSGVAVNGPAAGNFGGFASGGVGGGGFGGGGGGGVAPTLADLDYGLTPGHQPPQPAQGRVGIARYTSTSAYGSNLAAAGGRSSGDAATPVLLGAAEADADFAVAIEGAAVVLPAAAAAVRTDPAPARKEIPVLGDQPTAGELFAMTQQTAGANRRSAVGQEVSAAPATRGFQSQSRGGVAVDEDLAPLPLSLPVPAFMGTPIDLSLGEVKARSRAETAAQPASAAPATPAPANNAGPVHTAGYAVLGFQNDGLWDSNLQLGRGVTPTAPIPQLAQERYLGVDDFGAVARKPAGQPSVTRFGEVVDALSAASPSQDPAGAGVTKLNLEGEQSRLTSAPMFDKAVQDLTEAGAEAKLSQLGRLAELQDLAKTAAPSSEAKAKGIAQVEELRRELREEVREGEERLGKELAVASRPVMPVPQAEVATAGNPFSTFSLNVADVSYRLAAASLESGKLPEAAAIRVEDFVNAFDYRDPEPVSGQPVALAWERARHPFAHNREVLRFSVQTAASGREAGRPLNLVLLVDSSGSMERADRVAIIREALRVLAGQLQPADQISVVGFARTPRLWVDGLPGSQAAELPDRVGEFTPEGGTNLEAALQTGYETLARHFQAEGVNRLILLTDGAANLGDVVPESLQRMVETQRRRGLALDCFGIGWEGYNDDLLEVLSRNGDGRYGFVNSLEEVATDFAAQLTGALQVAAADAKVQVEFNPARVVNWRQIGYAKHQLTAEQFRDNTVDAAEIGAAEAGNALYAVEVNPQGQGPLGVVRVRYRVPSTGQYHEHEWALDYRGPAPLLESASPALRLATTAALFGERLSESPFAGDAGSDRLLTFLEGVPEAFAPDPRPKKLEWMLRQAKSVSGQ